MKITKAQLLDRKIYNPYNIASAGPEPKVFIDYNPLGDSWNIKGWEVCCMGSPTSYFSCWRPREDKEPQRLAALAWATERYGIQEWERSPFGSYHPKGWLQALDRSARRTE